MAPFMGSLAIAPSAAVTVGGAGDVQQLAQQQSAAAPAGAGSSGGTAAAAGADKKKAAVAHGHHGRWAMLATLGALSVEWLTGVTWQDAGKVELVDRSSYLGQPPPFSILTLIWIEVLVIGYIGFQRNAELDPEKRLYPGGSYFDPLGLAADPEKKERLQRAEIKHARLAMVAFLGFAMQAAATGKGPLNNCATHLSDPLHTTIFDTYRAVGAAAVSGGGAVACVHRA